MARALTFLGAIFLVGCGDPGGTGGTADGGTAESLCRPPPGFTATLYMGECLYASQGDAGTGRSVCIPLPDGQGAVDAVGDGVRRLGGTIGVPPSRIYDPPYSADLARDPANCGACGTRCPMTARYCVPTHSGSSFGTCSPTP